MLQSKHHHFIINNMDSATTSKINSFQRQLKELELRESNLTSELEVVQNKIRAVKREIAELTKNEGVTRDILERVYEQRRRSK